MSETATTNVPFDEAILDELVPPPGPRWRRIVLWVVFLGAIGAFMWGTTTGTLVPKLIGGVRAWGGDGPISITVDVGNDSPVDIELIDGPHPRPGLSLMGYTASSPQESFPPGYGQTIPLEEPRPSELLKDPFPIRLGPNESVVLTIWYRVTDCDEIHDIDPGDGFIDLQVRIADGPASWITMKRSVYAQGLSNDGDEQLSWDEDEHLPWPATMAQRACSK
ncbi:MAG: hypothetical protein ABI239_11120 [Aquihabitans sp.]